MGLSEDDLDFLRENLEAETTVYETVLNLRTPGLNLARQPVACMMCGREVPFERIQTELVRASNTGLTICVNCGGCEGREGLHTFQVDIIQSGRRNGLPPCFTSLGSFHVWRTTQREEASVDYGSE